jgi:hypothetical protein
LALVDDCVLGSVREDAHGKERAELIPRQRNLAEKRKMFRSYSLRGNEKINADVLECLYPRIILIDLFKKCRSTM